MKNIRSSLKGRYFACQLNLFIPWEEPYFFEIITVDQKTASNIPVERHCLGYGLNHQNRHTRCHKFNWGVCEVKNENVQQYLIPRIYWVYPKTIA